MGRIFNPKKLDGKKGNPARDLVEMTLLRTFIALETVLIYRKN